MILKEWTALNAQLRTTMEREINWQEGLPVSVGECQHLKVKCHVVHDVGENLANQFHTTPGLG